MLLVVFKVEGFVYESFQINMYPVILKKKFQNESTKRIFWAPQVKCGGITHNRVTFDRVLKTALP